MMAGCVAPEEKEVLLVLEHCLKTGKLMTGCWFALGCGTGGRASELLDIQREMLLSKGKLRDSFILNKLKARKSAFREIPWNHKLDKYVLPWLIYQQEYLALECPDDYVFTRQPGKHISRQRAWSMLREVYAQLGIDRKIANHGMRKFFGRGIYFYFGEKTGDQLRALELARQALGHSRIDTTICYLNIEQDNIKEALDDIFGFIK
jgi:site-specific recombinase XerD